MSSTLRGPTGASLQAIVLTLLSCLFFALLDASSKWVVTHGVDVRFAVWARFASQVVAAFFLFRMWAHPATWQTRRPVLQVVRALSLGLTTAMNFLSLQTLALVELIAILFVAPMLVTVLAGPLLGEQVGWRRMVAVLVGFAGMLIVIRPGLDGLQIGHLFALAAMVSLATYFMLTRSMNETETVQSLLFWSAAVPALLFAPAVPLYGSIPDDPLLLVLVCGLGAVGAVGHYLLILAYARADVSALSPYLYSQIVWAALLGWAVFDDLPDRWTVIGSVIIVGSGLYVGWRERRRRMAPRVPEPMAV